MGNKEITILLKSWDYTCGDGCCYEYGTDIYVNGERVSNSGEFVESALIDVLTHLGYKVTIEQTEEE